MINLQPFNRDNFLKYLKTNFISETEQEINEFYDLIKYSSENMRPYTINKYKQFMSLTNLKIKDLKSNSDFKNEIIQDYEIFEKLSQRNQLAWDILKNSAFLDNDFIPRDLYLKLLNVSKEQLEQSIKELKSLAFITVEYNTEIGFKIHRLLQDEVKEYLKKKQNKKLA